MRLGNKLTYRSTLAIPFRVAPVLTVISTLISLVLLAVAPINVLVIAYFINTALAVVNYGQDASSIVLPLVAIAAFSINGYIIQPMLGLVNQRQQIKTRLALRVPFLEKRTRLEYKHAENKDTVDLISRVWDNPEGQIGNAYSELLHCIISVGSTISFTVILIASAPLAGVILIVLSVPIFLIASKAGKARFQAHREATLDDRLAGHIRWHLSSRDAVAERNLFGYTSHLNKKFEHHFEANRLHQLKTNRTWFLRSKTAAMILGLLSSASLFIMAPAVASGTLSVGMFIALQVALFSAVSMIGWALPYFFQQFTRYLEYLKDVNKFFELSETVDANALPVQPPPVFELLEFKNVSFVYPGTEKLVLDNLSLTIENGKHYAFVGVNGAGKTTLTKLITGLYDNYTGEILLNGKPLREWTLPQIKACFCALFQDFARYDITVAENVAIGKISGATDEEVDYALDKAGFEKTAAELKDGKNTLLGKTHEFGVDLSGGQWQRLAFARAIISPAPVKILDEPTAALDPVAERQVYAQFESISRGFTTIFISHRLASAKLADKIFVLDGGKVAEEGSHDQLMAAKGIYAEMFESQQSWYK